MDDLGVAQAFFNAWTHLATQPWRLWQANYDLWLDYARLSQYRQLRTFGARIAPVVAADPADKRFRNEMWSKELFFDWVKQLYLINARYLQRVVGDLKGMNEREWQKVDFFTRQFITATAPSNFALTNPEVWDQAKATNGRSLADGWRNMLNDFDPRTGQLRMRQADLAAFEMGKNIAATPGKVVYQTDLMQLLQFNPTTTEVLKRPLLIVPPWINKYYVLDLQPKNSFIKWATDQGHTVFVISWVNPDAKLAQKGFDAYLSEGTLAAVDAIEKQTGQSEINAIGYCIGGTLLATTLGVMAGKGDKRIAGATFFTTMTDFAEPGELGVFIDEKSVCALEKQMAKKGYLDGYEMASAFGMMRAQEFIWPFYISRYLLGKQPSAFDLLYWNSDSTRMPAKMHTFYLRNMYLHNLLREPGGITLLGTPIDLSKVTVPCCFISTIEDHIAPWKSTYAGAKRFGGPVHFVLGGSGHVGGIINPPAANKYGYRLNDALPADPEEWLKGATEHSGSWWPHWMEWISGLDEEKVAARDPRQGNLPALEEAPGSYCKLRLDV
jgi:polyhydroxyalkanoate synthase